MTWYDLVVVVVVNNSPGILYCMNNNTIALCVSPPPQTHLCSWKQIFHNDIRLTFKEDDPRYMARTEEGGYNCNAIRDLICPGHSGHTWLVKSSDEMGVRRCGGKIIGSGCSLVCPLPSNRWLTGDCMPGTRVPGVVTQYTVCRLAWPGLLQQ